jgi:hypothetical protein
LLGKKMHTSVVSPISVGNPLAPSSFQRLDQWLDFPGDAPGQFEPGDSQVIILLQIKPILCIASKEAREPKCDVSRYAGLHSYDGLDMVRGDAKGGGERVGTYAESVKIFFAQHSAGVDYSHIG